MRSRGLRIVIGTVVAVALVWPTLVGAQTTPTPANPSANGAPKADERAGANPSKATKRTKNALSGKGPQKEKITTSDSDDARTAPKADDRRGANPSRKKTL
jgi:hypothetical protein